MVCVRLLCSANRRRLRSLVLFSRCVGAARFSCRNEIGRYFCLASPAAPPANNAPANNAPANNAPANNAPANAPGNLPRTDEPRPGSALAVGRDPQFNYISPPKSPLRMAIARHRHERRRQQEPLTVIIYKYFFTGGKKIRLCGRIILIRDSNMMPCALGIHPCGRILLIIGQKIRLCGRIVLIGNATTDIRNS